MNNDPLAQTAETKQRMAALTDQLRTVEQEIEDLTGRQGNAVAGEDDVRGRLRGAQEKLRLQEVAKRHAAEMQMAIINALPAHIALLDTEGVILAVNEAWRRFASTNVLQGDDFFVGQNYLDACESADGDCAEEARAAADGIRSVLAGAKHEFSLEYSCHSKTEKLWFRLMVTPLCEDQLAGAVVMHVNITERKLAADSIAQSEVLLRIAGQAARLGGWTIELPDYQLNWSDEICLIHDMPVGETPTLEEAIRFYPPEYRDEVSRQVKLCAEEGEPFDFEMELITAKQRRIWVRAIGEAVRDEKNQIIRVQGAFQDISQQKAEEEAARSAGERLLDTVESITDGFFTVDREWRFTYVNGEAERLLGCDRSSLLGRTVWEAFPPAVGTVFEKEYRRAVAENRTITFEEYYPPLDMWIEVKAYPSADGMAAYFRDVSERRSTLAALRDSEASLVRAQQIARIGNWDWDIVTDQVYWSVQAYHLYGLEPTESKVDYPTFLKCVHPEDRERVDEAVQACVAGEPYNIEHRVLWPDGTLLVVQAQGKLIRDAGGKALRMTGTVQDITERKRMETALAEKTRALELLSRCNEALIRSETEMELLEGICQCAVDVGGYQRAWVGYALDDADKSIVPKASVGAEDDYLAEITISWAEDSPNGQGPAGRAIRSGLPTVIPDLETDESFRPWLKAAIASGIRGVICLPLKDATRTFGLLGLHLPELRHPQPGEMHVLQELADNMAFGIVNLRDRHARQQAQSALLKVAAAVSATTGRQFFEQLAGNMAQALGAHAGFVAQFLPGEPLTARTIAATVDGELTDNFDYVIEGTPCESLMDSDICIISSRVAQLFPNSPGLAALDAQSYVGRRLDSSSGKFLGLLFVLFREPLQEPDLVTATLQIFAARAASELERQQTDVRVREQAALLDKARDGVFVRDLDHKILYWNHGAERLYGVSAAEALGRNVRELIPRDADAIGAAFEKLMATGESIREIEHVTQKGSVVIIERHCSLIHDENGDPRSVLSINTDITGRKKLEAQYLRAQRMESIGTLAGGIAHDLNNVLTPIMMSIEMLKMREQDPLRLEILNTIEGSAKRGADMVLQVLSFARGVEGRQLEVQVGHLLKEIKKIAWETFPKNIEVRGEIPKDLWLVQGDPTQLHQVLLNLCVNARDAMPDGGTLTLTASNITLDEQYAGLLMEAEPGPHVCIEVEDTGTGMPPEVIDRIFEPFFTTKELDKGTGLGLSTSLAIIRSHGGFVRVYSEVGMGSHFHVYLPAHIRSGAANDDNAPVDLPRGKGELVLVVDDEAAVRQITRQTLEAFGYHVLLASDGVEATSIYATRKNEIAVVLTDMMMPLMDGPTTIQVLLKMNPQVRIIAASGLNANGMVAKATGAGIKHFLPKPYTAETLLKTLRDVIEG